MPQENHSMRKLQSTGCERKRYLINQPALKRFVKSWKLGYLDIKTEHFNGHDTLNYNSCHQFFNQCSLYHHSLFQPYALNILCLQYSEYGWVLFNNDLISQRPSLSAKHLICCYSTYVFNYNFEITKKPLQHIRRPSAQRRNWGQPFFSFTLRIFMHYVTQFYEDFAHSS
jgi:hypothetical protein